MTTSDVPSPNGGPPNEGLPEALAEIVDDFAALGLRDRTTMLIEFGKELAPLPESLEQSAMEPVPECQSPLFLSVDATDPHHVRLHFSAPPEAPTTRGFAAILQQGLDGASREQILAVPDAFIDRLSLDEVVSPLRMRGMSAMLARIKARLSV